MWVVDSFDGTSPPQFHQAKIHKARQGGMDGSEEDCLAMLGPQYELSESVALEGDELDEDLLHDDNQLAFALQSGTGALGHRPAKPHVYGDCDEDVPLINDICWH